MEQPACLALEDGTVFRGKAIGALGHSVGEVIFNTAMTGYQEILTDPSYAQQMVTLTYPHIGNVGCNLLDEESARVWATGLIIRDLSLATSSWRSEFTLQSYLEKQQVVGIAEIDTRHLTHLLREKGVMNGCIMSGEIDEQSAIAHAQAFSGLQDQDLARVVSCKKAYTWVEPSWFNTTPERSLKFHVVVYDFGVKRNILRSLVDSGCRLTVVPAETPASEVIKMKPDGVLLSNGPGDPAPCTYAIAAIKSLLKHDVPILGICLGHQLLALAAGAKTIKMKFGHRGANHPVQILESRRVAISSQNHGFTVADEGLPSTLEVTHRSLFDGTIQGLRVKGYPAVSYQGHPEASPGPRDLQVIFSEFTQMMAGVVKVNQPESVRD